mgnify:CR=1 FL=1
MIPYMFKSTISMFQIEIDMYAWFQMYKVWNIYFNIQINLLSYMNVWKFEWLKV